MTTTIFSIFLVSKDNINLMQHFVRSDGNLIKTKTIPHPAKKLRNTRK